ncbi:hypothetical protein [Pseudomonas brassicae]|uniref:hypothetical protein n=1 Tax=Pseudomonas brassicae TaxID=2708063 RepID=UPI0030838AF1
MPVKHDLLADLNLTKEAFNEKKQSDWRLSQLHDQYNTIDAEVLEAEDGGPAMTRSRSCARNDSG